MRQRSLRLGFAAAFVLVASAAANAQSSPSELSPDRPYQAERSNPVTHEVDFRVAVTPPYHCNVLKVWLPLPPSNEAQQVSESELSTFPSDVQPTIAAEPVYGNRFAYFEFHKPRGAQIIRHRFTAKVWRLDWDVELDRIEMPQTWPAAFASYLQPQTIADGEQYNEVIEAVASSSDGEESELLGAMRWIDKNLSYDHSQASLQADANHALRLRRGHCSDYHGLCATMGRSLGFPTRITYGMALYPKNSPSHCKLEAFLPPYGWVSYDLSETQKLVKKINESEELSPADKERFASAARQRSHAGFRENSWLQLTNGTDYELAPKASRRVRVVRTIYAEADGEPLPDPDPADVEQRTFAWMTAHSFESDRSFKLPFKDWTTLEN